MMNSSHARAAIFASIRENLAASVPFDNGHHDASAISLAPPAAVATDVLDLFRESLEMVGAKCTVVENENDATSRLSAIVSDLAATNMIVSDSELVHRIVDATGIDAIAEASRDELFSSDLGITTAQWAIAETGTLVLESGAERHRLVSLVPPVHVCLLRASTIRRSMAEILELADVDTSPAITFVTGASRTSDIELTLAIGVHGPGELYVIVIQDQ